MVSPPVVSKAQTPYDKIAESFIAADKEIESLPIRRDAKLRREAGIDPRWQQLEELRLEAGEDVWPTLLNYFPIYESPARIEVEPWAE